jgi:hypothetical protein
MEAGMVNVLLIIFGIALIVVFIQRNKNPELSKLVMIGLVVVLFILQGIKWFGGGDGEAAERVQITYTFQSAAASILGQQIARDLDGGKIVLMQTAPDTEFARSQEAGLKEGLGDGFSLEIASLMESGMDDMMMLEGLGITGDILENVVRDHPGAVALVSAVGIPYFENRPPQNMPPLYILEAPDFGENNDLLSQGTVQALIQYKSDVDWQAKPARGMSKEEIFDLRYTLITAD